jgi:hypothetical protein
VSEPLVFIPGVFDVDPERRLTSEFLYAWEGACDSVYRLSQFSDTPSAEPMIRFSYFCGVEHR